MTARGGSSWPLPGPPSSGLHVVPDTVRAPDTPDRDAAPEPEAGAHGGGRFPPTAEPDPDRPWCRWTSGSRRSDDGHRTETVTFTPDLPVTEGSSDWSPTAPTRRRRHRLEVAGSGATTWPRAGTRRPGRSTRRLYVVELEESGGGGSTEGNWTHHVLGTRGFDRFGPTTGSPGGPARHRCWRGSPGSGGRGRVS